MKRFYEIFGGAVWLVAAIAAFNGFTQHAIFFALIAIDCEGDALVSGGCRQGADRFAVEIAIAYDLMLVEHLPDKSRIDPKLPYRAAYKKIADARNSLIAADADVLIACIAPDRKGGTEDTIEKFVRKTYVRHDCYAEAELIEAGKLVLV